MNTLARLTGFFFIIASSPSYADGNYPEEFADFFVQTEQATRIQINAVGIGVDIHALVNFDSFVVEKNSVNYQKLHDYLQKKQLKADVIAQILAQAQNGITSDPECQSRLSDCKLSPLVGQVRYVYDFDNRLLKLFVPPNSFHKQGLSRRYQSGWNNHHALINNSRLSANYNDAHTASIAWSNDITWGLPFGYINIDSQLNTSNDPQSEFDIFQALYNAEYNQTRLQVGRSNYNLSFNTTDYLANGLNFSGNVIAVGRSQNLLVGETTHQQQYEFYAPQSGVLTVYRGEELIFSRVISEGLQIISYHDLPSGVYRATIELKVGDRIVQNETIQIINNNRYTLPVGEWDYTVSAGQFEKQDNNTEHFYARGAVNYRVNNAWFAGAAITSDNNDQYWQLGSTIYWGDDFIIDYSGGLFSQKENYHMLTLSYGGISFDYRRFESNLDDDDNLSQQLLGNHSFEDLGVGFYSSFKGANVYARYSYFVNQDRNNADNQFFNKSQQHLTTVGISHAFLGGNLSFTANHNSYDNNSNQMSMNLSWSKSFDNGISSQTNNYFTNDGFKRSFNSASYTHHGDNYYAAATAGVEIDHFNSATNSNLSTSYGLDNRYVNVDAYAYANNTGSRSININLANTQILTSNSLSFTSETGRAFTKIKVNGLDKQPLESHLYLNIKEDSSYSHRFTIDQPITIYPLNEYNDITLDLDEVANNVDLSHKPLKAFVKPGTMMSFDGELTPLLQKIVIFDDLFKQHIEDLMCIGKGCVSVEPLSDDGVYSINYRADKPIQLLSSKGLCLYDDNSQQTYTHGFCLPLPDQENLQWQSLNTMATAALESNAELIIYLGKFKQGDNSNTIAQQLKSNGLNYKRINIGYFEYYYIVNTQLFSATQSQFLTQLNGYVINKNAI